MGGRERGDADAARLGWHVRGCRMASKCPRAMLAKRRRMDTGLTETELRRMDAVGLPTAFIVAVFRWIAETTGRIRDLDGVEFFAGCCSFSNSCRSAGRVMSGLPSPARALDACNCATVSDRWCDAKRPEIDARSNPTPSARSTTPCHMTARRPRSSYEINHDSTNCDFLSGPGMLNALLLLWRCKALPGRRTHRCAALSATAHRF